MSIEFNIENMDGDLGRAAHYRRRPKDCAKARSAAIQAAKNRAANLISPDEFRRKEAQRKWREGGE